jgi:hypothetical protein
MKLAVMQPYLFPYIGYYQLLHAVDRFVAYDDVNFIKQGWINRNRILVNGDASFITVPVRDRSSFRLIRDVEIDGADAPWRSKLLKTIANTYRRAPHFRDVFPLVERVFTTPATHIAAMALDSLTAVMSYLGMSVPIERSSVAYAHVEGKGQDRVIAICRQAGATEYVNPSGAGIELYSTDAFAAAGVQLHFLQPELAEYRQFGAPFVPGLSMIDVLMFNPPPAVCRLLERYQLT